MNPSIIILVVVGIMLYLVFAFIWASRYVKVGPNQVLIVSGRQRQLPDGTRVGFRLVKGGGTFVLPVVEKADVLSLEVFSVEMPKSKAQAAKGESVQTDCVAQLKIKRDDSSIIAATEHFLSKSEGQIKDIVRPILEKHLRVILGRLSLDEAAQQIGACAAAVESAASGDMGNMGLGIVSFTIENVRAG